jgi:hypothetical protein
VCSRVSATWLDRSRTRSWSPQRRREGVYIGVNLGSDPVEIDSITGSVALATAQGREGERVAPRLPLGPAEGAVVEAWQPDDC